MSTTHLELQPLSEEELRGQAHPVEHPDRRVQETIDRMLAFLARSGYPAISAPQIGMPLRVVAVDLSRRGTNPIVLLSPVLESVSRERSVDLEGCLNLPGIVARVSRPERIRVRAWTRDGQRIRLEVGGILARMLQHKIDHLDGILMTDHVSPTTRFLILNRARRNPPSCRLPTRPIRSLR